MSQQNQFKKEPYFMSFYKNVAILNQVYNIETKFLVQLMAHSDRDMIIDLSPRLKNVIMSNIGSSAEDKSKAANKHLNSLKRKGVIASAGRGAYMINPKIHGYNNAHKSIMDKNAKFIEMKIAIDSKGFLPSIETTECNKETGEIEK